MKMLTRIVAAIIILGGGCSLFVQPAAASEASKEDGGASIVQFVELSPFVLPIIDPNGVSQVVSMVVALEVNSEEAAAKVQQYEPRLKDAFLQDMYGALNRYAALKGGQIRLSIIKKRLALASKRVLGEDVVQAVLLQVVQQRPI